jgi:ubiquinone/menaquinone biosynthesis C-methylase UbiE
MTTESSDRNTYIFDPDSSAEMARLINLDHFMTQAMGGSLSGIDDPSSLHCVLDVACGPGGWALDVAYALPHAEVAGIDISKPMITYASARAQSQNLTNVSFGVMDITKPLDFSDNTFNLINARFLFTVLRGEAWLPLLSEYYRLAQPGGTIRQTELVAVSTTSAALQQQYALLSRYLYVNHRGFSPDGTTIGVEAVLPHFLKRAGFDTIRHMVHVQDFSQGVPAWAEGYRYHEVLGLSMLPLFVKQDLITQEEADRLHRQTMIDMLSDEYGFMAYIHTILATRPE